MTQELREEFECYLEELSAQAEPLVLPEHFSDYEIVACLQDTPQKKTFLLKHSNGRKILCKCARGDFQVMLKTEYELAIKDHFPFFPYVIDYQQTEEYAVLLREYIEGQTLRELVDENGPLSRDEALSIVNKVCHCLMRLHDAKPALIHRDIKPSNIVLTASGDCYLVDMGTLRYYQEGNSSDTFCMGTADFAAPEQYGARQTDARTDIYGLGMLFYFLLTGRSKAPEVSLAGVPRSTAAFIRKCIAFNPDDRYDNIHQVQRALDELDRKKKYARSRIAAWSGAAIFLILLAALIVPKLNIGDQEVVFSSRLMEEAVRLELGKSADEIVYQKELKKISRLEICGSVVIKAGDEHNLFGLPHNVNNAETGYGDIVDISLLAQMPNLVQLTLDYQDISDITPLKGLPLVSVSLAGNPISDLSPLSGSSTLCELDISGTKVISLDALTDCGRLQVLYCRVTPVKSLEPLAGLDLRTLALLDTNILDYGPLENMPLIYLECSYVSRDDLAKIKKITTLKELIIFHSNLVSLEAFAGFDQLFNLGADYDSLQSLDGIEKIPNLRNLSISNNPISECPAMPTLLSLVVRNTGVRDFTFLNGMPALTELTVSEAQLPCVTEAVTEPWFEIKCD